MMKRRIPESWLSAFVDGELDARRSALVARVAAKHPAIERRIDELRRISAAVASLPKSKLAGDARIELWSAVLKHPDLLAAEESAVSACLDGELSPTQAELVEKRTSNGQLKIANQYLEIGDALRDLTSYSAPADAVANALAQIKLEVVEGAEVAAELGRLPRVAAPPELLEQAIAELKPLYPAPPAKWFAWRREGWATGLAAALLTGVALFIYRTSANVASTNEGSLMADATKEPPVVSEVVDRSLKSSTAPVQPSSLNADIRTSFGKAAKIDDPIVDRHWMPDPIVVSNEKKLPPELPKNLQNLLRPGATIEVPGTEITFLCLDVQRMKERIQIVLLKSSFGDKNVRTKEGKDGTIVSVELLATPSQMGEVLTALGQHDETDRLIADLNVHEPKAKAVVADDSKHVAESPALANVPSKVAEKSGTPNDAKPAPPPPKEPVVVALSPDAPRQYLLVIRRQMPMIEEKKKG